MRVRAGSLDDLRSAGRLVTKVGSHGVCVFWDDGCAFALDDRCPHLGFPLHRGTVESGLVTCHWHNARFDLATGGTLDPFADDARAFPVEIVGNDVYVVDGSAGAASDPVMLARRLAEGLEGGLTLVTAKSVLGLLEAGVPEAEIVRAGVDFGVANRAEGWGAGLTVLVAMANLVPWLDPTDRALALVHGLAFVARDTRNHPPRFTLTPLGMPGAPAGAPTPERLSAWYRRFIETRAVDAAERTLATVLADDAAEPATVAAMLFAAATDHVLLDGGHTLDFTTKAFEALDHLGWESAPSVLPMVVGQAARASRSEEGGRWRHPHDLAAMVEDLDARIPELLAQGATCPALTDAEVSALAWRMLEDDPVAMTATLAQAMATGARPEQLGRAVAYAAALRITRFHVQNDFGDWDSVHHAFTYANAVHQAVCRFPSPELVRGVVHGAVRVYLDRFLNVPAARLPTTGTGDLDDLAACWDGQGGVDEAGAVAYGYLAGGGDPARLVAALGHGLLAEDAGFHWFQIVEAAVRQHAAWPAGSQESALILTGAARFLAAHTPSRRELPQVVRIATRLRRGDDLFEA